MRTIAETLRIEIPIETVDKTEPELSNLIRKMGNLESAAERTGNASQRAGERVSQFDRQAQRTEKSLANWMKEKYEILLEAKDKISPIVSTLGNGLRSFAGKTCSVTMRAIDFITSPVRGIINLLKNPIFQVGAVLGVSIGLKDTIETYKDFEAAMSQVEAISGATSVEMTKLTNKAKEMGATTKFTAAESAEAFNYMAMAGWKTEDMLGGIEGILSLAAASGESLGTTSDIVTDALTAFGMKASEAGHFADVMAIAASNSNTNVSMMGETFKYAGAMAGTLKYSIEDVALATGLMANAGIKGNMSGTALNSIFTRLSTNTNGATDALKKLGIAYFNSDGSARAFGDIMKELRDATADFTDKQKANLANTVAGTYAQKGFLAILNATTEDYDKLSEAVNNADGAAANMSGIMLDNLQGAITLLQSAIDGVKISFGERLAPYVRSFAEWTTDQIPMVEQGLNDLMDWIDMKIEQMQRKFNAIADTKEWQDADFFGKISIAWDEFIAEPFAEWWNGMGKAKFVGFAQDIGEGIGTGLRVGITALLGIDISETLDEGMSIGASFAKGFSAGFDFEAVSEKLWHGFKKMVSSAGKLLPGGESADLSSVLSAVMLSKIASPLISVGRGTSSMGRWLFGADAVTGVSRMGALIGSTGNAMVSGSGLLGTLANAGYGLTGGSSTAGMYFGNMAGAMSGGTAALVGAGSIAGGVVGAAGLIHGGMDLYKGFTSDDAAKAKAYKMAGAVEVGGTLAGAGAGAAAGAAIGAAFGGVGAIPGALIGAGIGAVGSWFAGNKIKDDYEKEAAEAQEKAAKEAFNAQKLLAATGFSIEDISFKSDELTQAMNDTEVSAAQFALMFQNECANVAKKAFGDISLSLAEVKKVASEITFAGMAEELSEFAKATADTEAALGSLESSVSSLKKENWKVGLGMELSESDKDGYKSAIESFLSTSQAFIDDNHYQATIALKLLTGEDVDTSRLDTYYAGLKGQMDDLGGKLTDKMNIYLDDGVITLDESAELESLQNQISEITSKLASAKTNAEFQALQIKHSGAALDMSSFNALQEELQAAVASASEQYDDALTMTITNLNLQLADGAITQEEYSDAVKKATEGYYANINEMDVRVRTFNLDSIAAAFDEQLSGIMPDVEGSVSEKLSRALDNAIIEHPDITAWTPQEIAKWMELDKLDLGTEEQTTIAAELKQIALTVPDGTKAQLINSYLRQVPTAEEIKSAIDWSSLNSNDISDMMQQAGVSMINNGVQQVNMPLDQWAQMYGKSFEGLIDSYVAQIHDSLTNNRNSENLVDFTKQYMPDFSPNDDFINSMSDYGPISNEYYEELEKEWENAGINLGTAFSHGASAQLLDSSSLLRTDMQTALEEAAANPFMVNTTVNMMADYNIISQRVPTLNINAGGHAAGGYVSGGPQLSWLAEEGYGEFVIPTNPSRRSRALELYEQAGAVLGVSSHADGGYVSGSILSGTASNYSGETAETYGPASTGTSGVAGVAPIQVSVDMSPEFIIYGGDGQSEEDIMQVIRRHLKEMADELGGEIAGKLEEVFSNMPLKEA